MSGWYYVKSGTIEDQTIGPLSDDQFMDLVEAGKLSPKTVVRHASHTGNQWVPANAVAVYREGVERGRARRQQLKEAAREAKRQRKLEEQQQREARREAARAAKLERRQQRQQQRQAKGEADEQAKRRRQSPPPLPARTGPGTAEDVGQDAPLSTSGVAPLADKGANRSSHVAAEPAEQRAPAEEPAPAGAAPSGCDRYHYYLGIPPRDQPPNHYRLLGLERLEANLEIIEMAADRQMAYLQLNEAGEHAEDVAKLMSEVSRARLCLLNPQRKSAYDAQLRATMEAEAVQEPAAMNEAPVAGVGSPSDRLVERGLSDDEVGAAALDGADDSAESEPIWAENAEVGEESESTGGEDVGPFALTPVSKDLARIPIVSVGRPKTAGRTDARLARSAGQHSRRAGGPAGPTAPRIYTVHAVDPHFQRAGGLLAVKYGKIAACYLGRLATLAIETCTFYWSRRHRLWLYLLHQMSKRRNLPHFAARRRLEIDFSQEAQQQFHSWEVELPKRCVSCGTQVDGPSIQEEQRVEELSWSLWCPLAGLMVGLVLWLVWSAWLVPLMLFGAMVVGRLARREQRLMVRFYRCSAHAHATQFPEGRLFGGNLYILVGAKSVKDEFARQRKRDAEAGALKPLTTPRPELSRDWRARAASVTMPFDVDCPLCGLPRRVDDPRALGIVAECSNCAEMFVLEPTDLSSSPSASDELPLMADDTGAEELVEAELVPDELPPTAGDTADVYGPNGNAARRCPFCAAPLRMEAVLCVQCGFDLRTGTRHRSWITGQRDEASLDEL